MSDPRDVPPTYGTEHQLGDSRRIPYREEPGLRDEHRRNGTHPYSDGEVIARIQADAEAEALKGHFSEEPYTPPIMWWLEGVFQARLHRDLPGTPGAIAQAITQMRAAAADQRNAARAAERGERELREAESELEKTETPATGKAEAGRTQLFAVRTVAAGIEIFATGEPINAAFGFPFLLGYAFAAAIALIFLFAAEQTAMVLARSAASHTRTSKALAIGLGVVCLGFGAWTVISLTEGRENLIEYANPENHNSGNDSESANVGFGDLAAGTSDTADKASTKASANQGGGDEKPELGFMLPLMFLAVASSALVAYRVELASEWKERSEIRQEAVVAADELRTVRDESEADLEEAGQEEIERTIDIAAHVEQTLGLLGTWQGQWQADYVRYCNLHGNTPRTIVVDPLPPAANIVMQLLDPLGAQNGPVAEPVDEDPPREGPEAPSGETRSTAGASSSHPEGPDDPGGATDPPTGQGAGTGDIPTGDRGSTDPPGGAGTTPRRAGGGADTEQDTAPDYNRLPSLFDPNQFSEPTEDTDHQDDQEEQT